MSTPLRLALVGCGKDKLEGKHPAADLYTGPLFRGYRDYALARYPREHVLVLSAHYGVLALDAVVASYNLHLEDLGAEARTAWAEGVARELRGRFPVEEASVEVLASALYVDTLRPHLPPGWEVSAPVAGLTLPACQTWIREARESLAAPAVLRVPALEVEQSPGRRLYLFSVDGKQVPRFATVSRVKRMDGHLQGYQRPEAHAHVQAIRAYMESASPLVPNAVVLAFDSRVHFEALAGAEGQPARHGHLVIPLVEGEGAPGFIVDGQQRLAAVREAEVASFPLACSAFITDDVGQQAEQFILVNTTKPLPKGLIYELLPTTRGALPDALHKKRLPALLVERLNQDEDSPLRGLIITVTNMARTGKTPAKWSGRTGLIKDTSVLKALEYSLSDGALYELGSRREPDVEAMLALLRAWWGAVKATWPKAWGRSPAESRLFHGAGMLALGLLMDAAVRELDERGVAPSQAAFEKELAHVKPACAWTEGEWRFPAPTGPREWRAIQNTPNDVRLLATYLVTLYLERTRKAGRRTRKAGAA